MHVQVKNGKAEPYSVWQLRRDNPDTSFRKEISDTKLAEFFQIASDGDVRNSKHLGQFLDSNRATLSDDLSDPPPSNASKIKAVAHCTHPFEGDRFSLIKSPNP